MSEPVCIALVDDEVDVELIYRAQLRKSLRAKEAELFFFDRAKGFLKFLDDKSADIEILILVTDVNMPEMDGLELVSIVKDKYPDIDLYVSSAYENEQYSKQCSELGVKKLIPKPVDFEYIKEIISSKYNELVAA